MTRGWAQGLKAHLLHVKGGVVPAVEGKVAPKSAWWVAGVRQMIVLIALINCYSRQTTLRGRDRYGLFQN